MKKEFLKVFVLFVALFIGVVKVNAEMKPFEGNCSEADLDGKASCNLIVTLTETTTIKTGDNIRIIVNNPVNIKDNAINIEASEEWTVNDGKNKEITVTDAGVELTFVYNGTDTLSNTNVTLGYGEYQKSESGDECGFSFGLLASACSIEQGHYYGINGNEVDEDTYYKECFYCTIKDGHYYGLSGKEVDEATYNKECTNICKIENGKYYCKDGNECTKEDYDNECPKNTNTGAFLPVAGIVAGIALIGVSTIMVRRQTKLRRL